MRASTSAIALMPAPATPTMWTRLICDRSSKASVPSGARPSGSIGTGLLLDEVSEPLGCIRPCQCARRSRHLVEAVGVAKESRHNLVQPGGNALVVAQAHRGAN